MKNETLEWKSRSGGDEKEWKRWRGTIGDIFTERQITGIDLWTSVDVKKI